ncbi:hypothetical protein HPP92_025399 [Vanilla planifolia]|uniref:Protein ENHANCED DISEASE RESISTANCE 2 C-terminal domain-containing protein n=1 Tax=Vanilla planifolia TaxID=51239 RepID=A0A835PFB6_VANPL|nr:hypothetical protein HPP92_025399 [Vanilla planifolia]
MSLLLAKLNEKPLLICNAKTKFLIQSVITNQGATLKDITQKMFSKESGNTVNEERLAPAAVEGKRRTYRVWYLHVSIVFSRSCSAIKLNEEKTRLFNRTISFIRTGALKERSKRRGGFSFIFVTDHCLAGIVLGYLEVVAMTRSVKAAPEELEISARLIETFHASSLLPPPKPSPYLFSAARRAVVASLLVKGYSNFFVHMAGADAQGENWIEEVKCGGSVPFLEPENCPNGWATPHGDKFMVRGPNYLKDKMKIPGGEFLLKPLGFDWVKVPSKDNFSAIIYFVTTQPFQDESLMDLFVKSDDAFRNTRLKLIANIAKGPWIVKTAVGEQAICILGRALSCKYFLGQNFLEVDVDIGASVFANAIVHLAFGYIKTLTVDLAFLIEGQSEVELPEKNPWSCKVLRT